MLQFGSKYQTLQKTHTHFGTSSHSFKAISNLNFLPSKAGKGHGAQFSQFRYSVANSYRQILAVLSNTISFNTFDVSMNNK